MASTPTVDGADDALSEKEWREMRRRMTTLQFEPVPETPALLPRSLYADGDGDGDDVASGSECGDHGTSMRSGGSGLDDDAPYREHAHDDSGGDGMDAALSASEDLVGLERSRVVMATFDRIDAAAGQSSELSLSTATVVSPTSKKATLKSSKRRSTTSPVKKLRRSSSANASKGEASVASAEPPAPVDLTDLEAVIVNAQDQLRQTILQAVHETTTRHERDAALEQRKREAAHTNRVALLQSQLDELQATAQAQQHEAHDATQTLERVTRLMCVWKQRERDRWRSPHSLHVCFGALKQRWQHKKQEQTQQHFATQFQKRHTQQLVLHQWRGVTQQNAFDKALQTQRDEHNRAIAALKQEHETRLQQLQSELASAQDTATVAQHGREQLEGDLRQVFLRGVSAMNIEALSLFKTNHQQRLAQLRERGQEDRPPQQLHVHFQHDERRGSVASTEDGSTNLSHSGAAATGGESSEELPSEERMVPIKPPPEMVHDPVRQRLQALLPGGPEPILVSAQGVMPSSVVANRLLKHAGSCEVVSTSAQPFTDSTMESMSSSTPPTSAIHGLRSAELVEAHQRQLHAAATRQQPTASASMDTLSGYSLSPAQQRLRAQSSMQFNVEMELMRSSVAAAAALGARYPNAAMATASATSRRSGNVHGSSLAAAASSSSSTRRTSSFSSPPSSSAARTKWRPSPS